MSNPYLEGNPYMSYREEKPKTNYGQYGLQIAPLALQLYGIKKQMGSTPKTPTTTTTPPGGTEGLDAFKTLSGPEYEGIAAGEDAAVTAGQQVGTEGLEAFSFAQPAYEGFGAAEYAATMAAEDAAAGAAMTQAGGGSSAGSGGSAAGTSAAGVLAYIAAAELARGQWGGKGKGFDEKSQVEKMVDNPGTAGAWILPALFSPDDKFYKEMARMERGAMAPIDTLFGDRDNWFAKAVGCIIISACTSRDSYEVNIARQFRDKYMDEETLTGYYTLCVFVVPFIQQHQLFRRIVKKLLVDRLVDYGEWRLGLKADTKFMTSGAVKRVFLGLCRHIGKGVDTVLAGQEV